MSNAAAPIELAPKRWSRASSALHGVRVGARWVHLTLALAVVAGVFVQVYLIGAYIFGAGQGALDAHKTAGWTVHGFEMLVFVGALVAWLPWVDLVLSLLLAVIGTVQVALANGHRWIGGLHPALALVVVGLAATLVQRAIRQRRDPRLVRS
jgi:asparagine N-glycosylation enzyme membrane subunit Stt3